MKRVLTISAFGCFLLAACLLQVSATAEDEKGFVPIFNGRDLTHWTGEPGWWIVEDGAITAKSTTAKPCVRHTYLVWEGGEPGDFDLRLEFRLVGGNSGVQDTGADYQSEAKLIGPRAKIRMWFENGTELRLHLDGDRGPGLGAIFIGEHGKIEINRDKIASNPAELVNGSENPGPLGRPETAPHIENWIECIKSRQPCTADIEIGQRASTLCYLVNIVREVGLVGQKLHWDPIAERFTDSEKANAFLACPRRAGFELPGV